MRHSMIKALAGALLTLAGCGQMELDVIPGSGGLCITVDSGEIGTRTTETDQPDGVGRENLIKTIDYFLFAGEGTGKYLYKGHVKPGEETKSYTVYDHAAITGLADGVSYKVFTIVNYPGDTADLGANGSPSADADKRTKEELDQLLLSESQHQTFLGSDDDNPAPADDDKLFLVMTGDGTFTFHEASSNEISVPLSRLAAKVTVEFYVKDEIRLETSADVTETWTPMTDGTNVRVYLCRGAKTVRLGGGIPGDAELEFFDYQPGSYYSTMKSEKEGFSHAFASDAFYTYPRKWMEGSADEPYLKLIIPWKVHRVAAGVATEYQKEFYYKVMLPSGLAGEGEGKGFKSNNWYRLLLDVDRVGSITEDAAVELACYYEVAPWKSQNVTSRLVEGYYLDVNNGRRTLEVYATNTVEIPYFASGPVVLRLKYPTHTDTDNDGIADDDDSSTMQPTEVSFYQYNLYFSQLNSGDEQTNGSRKVYLPSGESYKISLRESDHHIIITHELKDNYAAGNKDYDVSPFEFTFTLGLENDPTGEDHRYDKEVTVIQYPPLYIRAKKGGNVFVKGIKTANTNIYSRNGTNTYTGAVNSTNFPYYIGRIFTPASITGGVGFNISPYMIEVCATILKNYKFYLGPNSQYPAVIGDPRIEMGERLRMDTNGDHRIDDSDDPFDFNLTDTDSGTGYISGNGENSFNTTYRPTSHDKANVIAPRFRVASSYGRTGATTYEGALRRCAAYQEDGYPAGRWRLPTPAEIAFLIKLSDDGYILSMFDPEDMYSSGSNRINAGYWASGLWGRFYVEGSIIEHTAVWATGPDAEQNAFRSMSDFTASYNLGTILYRYKSSHRYPNDSEPYNFELYSRCIYDSWFWDDLNQNTNVNTFKYMPVPQQ